jgi:hypothetical protein
MATNKRDLKAYARFDGSGRIVPGSLVLRRNKPKVGKWQEVQGYECCNDVTLTFVMPDVSINDVSLRLLCNGTQIAYGYTPQDSTNVDDVINILNGTFNMLGVFSNPSGQVIQLVMSGDMKTALCPVGTLSFEVVAD